MSSVDNICTQFRSRPGPTKRRYCSGSKLFDTDAIPEIFFRQIGFYKRSADNKKHEKLPSTQSVKGINLRKLQTFSFSMTAIDCGILTDFHISKITSDECFVKRIRVLTQTQPFKTALVNFLGAIYYPIAIPG